MQNNVGEGRNNKGWNRLIRGLKELSSIENYLDRSFSSRLELEAKNMACVARVIAASAMERKGSVGAHYRIDFLHGVKIGEDT